MDIFGNYKSSDSESEEADKRERLERLYSINTAHEAARKRKIEQKEAEEESWYQSKNTKFKPLTLSENLERAGISVAREKKEKFETLIPKVVEHFDVSGEDFAERMKKINTESQLFDFIVTRHKGIVTNPNETGKVDMHEWLVSFHKETINALREMTNIPKNDKLMCLSTGNVFDDAKEMALKHVAMQMNMERFAEQLAIQKEKEEKENEAIASATRTMLRRFSRIGISENEACEDDALTEELVAMSINEIRNPTRDTSPHRGLDGLSIRAKGGLSKMLNHIYIKSEIPREIKNEEEEDDDVNLAQFFSNNSEKTANCVIEEIENEDISKPRVIVKPSSVPTTKVPKKEEEIESSDEDAETYQSFIPNWKSVLGYEGRREPTNFGRSVTEEKQKEWDLQKYENKRKKTSTLQFEEFESPRNTMRIFAKPNGYLSLSRDDGPKNQYVDLTLQDGWDTFRDNRIKKPYIANYHVEPVYPIRGADVEETKQQKITLALVDWMTEYQGNILGRFWFPRNSNYDNFNKNRHKGSSHCGDFDATDEQYHRKRLLFGVLLQYTQEELNDVYFQKLEEIQSQMSRGLRRVFDPRHYPKMGNKDKTDPNLMYPVSGVLLFTDWRLVHMNSQAFTNTIVQFLPTNLGKCFFETMIEYLIELILDANIEFHTIIFAFGGSPQFRKEDFLQFWKKFVVHTTRSIDVFWMAQDWCDGLESNEYEKNQLEEFNNYVEKLFKVMYNTGHRNYKWCNIRRKYNHLVKQNDRIREAEDTLQLQNLYYSYATHFVNECNCYGASPFFFDTRQSENYDDYAENSVKSHIHEHR